jgi:hypothetical protein
MPFLVPSILKEKLLSLGYKHNKYKKCKFNKTVTVKIPLRMPSINKRLST